MDKLQCISCICEHIHWKSIQKAVSVFAVCTPLVKASHWNLSVHETSPKPLMIIWGFNRLRSTKQVSVFQKSSLSIDCFFCSGCFQTEKWWRDNDTKRGILQNTECTEISYLLHKVFTASICLEVEKSKQKRKIVAGKTVMAHN